MSLHSYAQSRDLATTGADFDAFVMAAMRQADSHNIAVLRQAFPSVWRELDVRYNRPFGGRLREEPPAIVPATLELSCAACGRTIAPTELVGDLGPGVELCIACTDEHFDLPPEQRP